MNRNIQFVAIDGSSGGGGTSPKNDSVKEEETNIFNSEKGKRAEEKSDQKLPEFIQIGTHLIPKDSLTPEEIEKYENAVKEILEESKHTPRNW